MGHRGTKTLKQLGERRIDAQIKAELNEVVVSPRPSDAVRCFDEAHSGTNCHSREIVALGLRGGRVVNDRDAKLVARSLLTSMGPPEAWRLSTCKAIDAHLSYETVEAAHWAEVQRELRAIAPRPGAGDLDIYSSARTFIGEFGMYHAWSFAMEQGVKADGNLLKQAYWLRVADAVNALSNGFGRNRV